MKVSLHWGQLFKMNAIIQNDKYLRKVLVKSKGVTWEIREGADFDEIDRLLKNKRINYDLIE